MIDIMIRTKNKAWQTDSNWGLLKTRVRVWIVMPNPHKPEQLPGTRARILQVWEKGGTA